MKDADNEFEEEGSKSGNRDESTTGAKGDGVKKAENKNSDSKKDEKAEPMDVDEDKTDASKKETAAAST